VRSVSISEKATKRPRQRRSRRMCWCFPLDGMAVPCGPISQKKPPRYSGGQGGKAGPGRGTPSRPVRDHAPSTGMSRIAADALYGLWAPTRVQNTGSQQPVQLVMVPRWVITGRFAALISCCVCAARAIALGLLDDGPARLRAAALDQQLSAALRLAAKPAWRNSVMMPSANFATSRACCSMRGRQRARVRVPPDARASYIPDMPSVARTTIATLGRIRGAFLFVSGRHQDKKRPLPYV